MNFKTDSIGVYCNTLEEIKTFLDYLKTQGYEPYSYLSGNSPNSYYGIAKSKNPSCYYEKNSKEKFDNLITFEEFEKITLGNSVESDNYQIY